MTAWIGVDPAASGTPDGLGDAGPQQAGGAELGDRGELVAGGGEPQLQAPEHGGRVDAPVLQRPQVLDAGGDRAPELLAVGRPEVVEAGAVDGDDVEVGAIVAEPGEPRGDGVELAVG